MVLVVFLHLVRVFFAGAYKQAARVQLGHRRRAPRSSTLAFSFTGYLLPWDQLSYWAVTVGTNLVHYVPAIGTTLQDLLIGGAQVGQTRCCASTRCTSRCCPLSWR